MVNHPSAHHLPGHSQSHSRLAPAGRLAPQGLGVSSPRLHCELLKGGADFHSSLCPSGLTAQGVLQKEALHSQVLDGHPTQDATSVLTACLAMPAVGPGGLEACSLSPL